MILQYQPVGTTDTTRSIAPGRGVGIVKAYSAREGEFACKVKGRTR